MSSFHIKYMFVIFCQLIIPKHLQLPAAFRFFLSDPLHTILIFFLVVSSAFYGQFVLVIYSEAYIINIYVVKEGHYKLLKSLVSREHLT